MALYLRSCLFMSFFSGWFKSCITPNPGGAIIVTPCNVFNSLLSGCRYGVLPMDTFVILKIICIFVDANAYKPNAYE